MSYDHAQSPRIGQKTTVESTVVRMFSGVEIPEAAWEGQVIYRTDLQILQVYNGTAWEDVVSGDLGIFTYVGPSIPVAHMAGDIWFDSDDFYKMYLAAAAGSDAISPSEWVLVQNSAGALAAAVAAQAAADAADAKADAAQNDADQALADAADAQATADGKVASYFQTTAPAGLVAGDVGDLWFDTDDGNKMYRWSGAAWVVSQDTAITTAINAAAAASAEAGDAQDTADSKIITFYQDDPPTSLAIGDLWVDTNADNLLYRATMAGANEIADTEWALVIAPPEPYVDPYTEIITLPTPDADIQDARIFARLEANEVVVNDNLRILGESNFIDGDLFLGEGVRRPATVPTVLQTASGEAATEIYPFVENDLGGQARIRDIHLIPGSPDQWVVLYKDTLESIHIFEDAGVGSPLVETDSIQLTNTDATVKPVSFTKLGSYYYVVCTDGTNTTIKVYNTSWVYQESQSVSSSSALSQFNISNDGTALFVVYRQLISSLYELRVVKKTLSGTPPTQTIATASNWPLTLSSDWLSTSTVVGLYSGAADIGTTSFVVVFNRSTEALNTIAVWSYEEVGTPSVTRTTSKDWPRWESGMESGGGLIWDGTRFHSGGQSLIYHYGSNPDIAEEFEFTYAWHKSTGEETMPSDPVIYTAPKRSWTLVYYSVPQAPADSVAIYINNLRQADVGIGVYEVVYDSNFDQSGDPHSGVNDFDALVGLGAGSIKSTALGVDDDNLVRFSGTGTVRMPLFQQSGTVSITSTAAVTNTEVVTFDDEFLSSPIIGLAKMTTAPEIWDVSFSSQSTTGMTVSAKRSTGTGTLVVHWIATTAS